MTLSWRRGLAVASAIAVFIAGLALAGVSAQAAEPEDFKAQAIASGLTAAQADALQARVDDVLANVPGGTQVSPTEIEYDGLNATVDPLYSDSSIGANAISCDHGWFCIDVRGTRFEFYTCQTWNLSDWWGNSPFNNNQTWGTVARAYGQNGNLVWSNVAKDSGTVNVYPWWSFRPC